VSIYTERMGFEAPTLVQAQAIPVILSGRDVYPFPTNFCLLFV
jgi:superfamily II DNA/RNA helicase